MGMTLEEAHKILSNGLFNAPSEHEWCIAFKMAIDTMRKYQKIEQIMADWNDGRFSDAVFCLRVKVVMEDGSN